MASSPKEQRSALPTENAATEFKTVLRIRPLLKKERDDAVALEKLDSTTGVLHPLVLPFTDVNNNNGASSDSVVQTGEDTEFRFDRVLSASDSQDKLYQAVGQPVALASMDSLKQTRVDTTQRKTTTHLVITTGLSDSGKTFASIGPHVSKRKSETDGLVPRIIDSLFAQSKHNFSASSQSKKVGFAVKITMLQINQSKSNPSDCEIYDLLQPVPKLPHKRSMSSSSIENSLGSAVGSLASTLMSISGSNSFSTSSTATPKNSTYTALNEGVKVQQDPVTSECFLANATERECGSAEEARESLQKALDSGRSLKHKKYQSHRFIALQPQLVSARSGRTLQTGETVAVLDLAVKHDKNKQRAAHLRTSLPKSAEDAYTSTLHCLKALRQNMERLDQSGRSHSSNKNRHDDEDCRKVPFLQHKLTMLLQPLFSAKNTDTTAVTLLVTASPSGRDHVEKNVLLNEIVALHRPSPKAPASTGMHEKKSHKQQQVKVGSNSKKKAKQVELTKTKVRSINSGKRKERHVAKSDVAKKAPPVTSIHRAPSMTYSETTEKSDVEPPPPPVAPGYKETLPLPSRQTMLSPGASAPLMDDYLSPTTVHNSSAPPPPILTVDFPGVPVPPVSTQSALTEASSRENSDGSFKPPPPNAPFEVPEAIAEEITTSRSSHCSKEPASNNNKFSYMKTINKVVHASKKKGRRVMEHMTFTSFTGDPTDLQNRVLELEEQNASLLQEIASLREKNKKLQQKLDKKEQRPKEEEPSRKNILERDFSCGPRPPSSPSLRKKDEDSVASKYSSHHEDDGNSSASSSEDEASLTPVSTSAEIKNNEGVDSSNSFGAAPDSPSVASPMFDNPLLQHMANMNNTSRWNSATSSAVATKHKTASATIASRNESFAEEERNENNPTTANSSAGSDNGPRGMFDDPLYQHMAMMNNYG